MISYKMYVTLNTLEQPTKMQIPEEYLGIRRLLE